jgi:hypothetical protein
LICGCGGNGPHAVQGVVLLDGAPLDGASVTFQPEGAGQPAIGQTAADGTFKLSTVDGTGAMPGSYRVLLSKVTGRAVETRPPWIGRRDAPPTTAEIANWNRETAAKRSQERETVPAIYTKSESTPLKVVVPVQGKVRLELSSTATGGQ